MKTKNILRAFLAVVALAAVLSSAYGQTSNYNHYKYKGYYYGSDKDGESTAVRDRVLGLYNADVNAYNAQLAQYNSDNADYENNKLPAYNAALAQYNVDSANYEANLTKYNNYLSALQSYNDRKAEADRNRAEWEALTGGSGVGVVIDADSHVDGEEDEKIVSKLDAPVEVPEFSDISAYRKYCQEYVCTNKTRGGTLECMNMYRDSSGDHRISFTYSDKKRIEYWSSGVSATGFTFYKRDQMLFHVKELSTVNVTRTLTQFPKITGGYAGAGVYPFTDRISGVSDTCEKGSVVLIGTYNYPIRLNGPVYVDGDVIIRGFVEGQGSIYAGRNIHIVGDITYFNPPSWPHDANELRKSENTPKNVKARNAGKDLLLLAARGNIIVGDYTSVEWTNSTQMAYLDLKKSGRTLKSVTTSETDIGYSAGYPANKDYTQPDGGMTVQEYTTVDGANQLGYIEGGGYIPRAYYAKTVTPGLTTRNRRYYESSLGAVAIKYLKQTSVNVNSKPGWQTSSTIWKRILGAFGRYEDNPTITDNTDSGDVTEVDAILYANHGVFGVAGGAVEKKFHLNGALICRDEGLLTSFAGRFSRDPDARAWLNWDMRIKSDLEGSVHVGAPESTSTSKGIGIKRIVWSYAR